jgi:uncharacterized protein
MTAVRAALVALLILVAFAASALAAPTFPKLTGRVVDGAQILSPQAEAALTQKLEAVETQTGRQFVVVTLRDLQDYEIADYGYQLGRAWGIGDKERNDGVLLIVAPNERKVRIEVGYGLEPILTDALSNVILQERVLPKFRAGDMEAGVLDGADAIIAQLTADQETAQKAVEAAAQPAQDDNDFPWWVIALIAFWIISGIMRGAFGGRRRRRGSDADWIIPWIIFSGMGRGGGGRGGGWSGGGGFSGGGGSFGGGGSSGSW